MLPLYALLDHHRLLSPQVVFATDPLLDPTLNAVTVVSRIFV